MEPETRYARSADVSIAYQVTGDGPFDVVYVPGAISHVELAWTIPGVASFLQGLSSFCRLIRFDKHAGECEVVDGKIGGIAVHTGARVASNASAGEPVVSSTVKDLVAGSGIPFTERGQVELKGIPGEWRLFAVDAVGVSG